MPIISQNRPVFQARACVRGPTAGNVRLHVASPAEGPNALPEEVQRTALQKYFTDAVQSVLQVLVATLHSFVEHVLWLPEACYPVTISSDTPCADNRTSEL